jgi:hypothetical protein
MGVSGDGRALSFVALRPNAPVALLTFLVLRLILNSKESDRMIKEFRQVWNEGCSGSCADATDDAVPLGPRSAGRVARWSLERAASILQMAGRTRLRIAQEPDAELTPHERSLYLISTALAKGDTDTASAHAQWLVRPGAINAFLRALEPVTRGPARLVEAA